MRPKTEGYVLGNVDNEKKKKTTGDPKSGKKKKWPTKIDLRGGVVLGTNVNHREMNTRPSLTSSNLQKKSLPRKEDTRTPIRRKTKRNGTKE